MGHNLVQNGLKADYLAEHERLPEEAKVEFRSKTTQSQNALFGDHENVVISRVIDILREIPHPDFFSKITVEEISIWHGVEFVFKKHLYRRAGLQKIWNHVSAECPLDETSGSDPSTRIHSLHSFNDGKSEFSESEEKFVVSPQRESMIELTGIQPPIHEKEL